MNGSCIGCGKKYAIMFAMWLGGKFGVRVSCCGNYPRCKGEC